MVPTLTLHGKGSFSTGFSFTIFFLRGLFLTDLGVRPTPLGVPTAFLGGEFALVVRIPASTLALVMFQPTIRIRVRAYIGLYRIV